MYEMQGFIYVFLGFLLLVFFGFIVNKILIYNEREKYYKTRDTFSSIKRDAYMPYLKDYDYEVYKQENIEPIERGKLGRIFKTERGRYTYDYWEIQTAEYWECKWQTMSEYDQYKFKKRDKK
jgi:hypothetical protein